MAAFTIDELRKCFGDIIDDKGLLTKEDIKDIISDLVMLRKENLKLRGELDKLQERVEQLENRSREKNLIIGNLTFSDNQNCSLSVERFISENLKPLKPLKITRAVPLCKPEKGKTGTVLVELGSKNEVTGILKRDRLLKGTSHFIQADLSMVTRKRIAKLC